MENEYVSHFPGNSTSGIDPARIHSHTPLGDGTYNSVWRIELSDAPALVLKVAPDPATPGLAYERDLLATEALFYDAARAAPASWMRL